MKKLSFIVMACLLVLGLTQCKKNESTNNNNTDDNRVSITLQLTNGGQKVHPEEENGLANVVYDNGDVVYVGSDGKYMGYLTYNGTLFTGSINDAATEGQPLQFIFMGGQTIEGLTENSSTECIFNIGDQSNGLAVISGAASNEDFSLTNLSYTAYLRNKCALVKFDLGEVSTDAAITLTGMKTEATIGFNGTVTNLSTTGDITTYGTGSTRYAVVLSDQEAVTEGTVSAEGYEGTFSIPTAAYTNAFLTDATMTLTGSVGPTAAAEATAEDKGKLIGTDGNIYADVAAATAAGTTAVAKIIYIGTTGHATYTHGLALALTDEASKMAWQAAIDACSAKNESTPVTNATWLLASKDQWDYMLGTDGAGSHYDLRDGFSSVGGSNLQWNYYYSSTEDDSDSSYAWYYSFAYGIWLHVLKGSNNYVRACLAF